MKEQVPESARRMGVVLRGDLEVSAQERGGRRYAVIKDPLRQRYYELAWEDYQLAKRIMPGMTIAEIAQRWRQDCAGMSDQQLQEKAIRLSAAIQRLGLSQTVAMPKGERQLSWGAWLALWARRISSPLFFRIRLFDPDELLGSLHERLGPLFSRAALTVGALFVLVSALFFFANASEAQFEFQWFQVWGNVLCLYLGIVLLKVVHEAGHALACKALGGKVHEVGMQVVALHLTFYVDVSETWMWQQRSKRIWVAAAGFLAELLMAAVLVWIWLLLAPGFARDLCLNLLFMASVSALVFNANPLLRYDGYHILSDLVGEPNLRQKSFAALRQAIRSLIFGARQTREKKRAFYIGYALCSSAFLVWIMIVISQFLVKLLEPYGLEFVAQILLASWALSVCLPVLGFVGKLWSELLATAPSQRLRPLAVGALGPLCLGMLLLMPVREKVERPCVLESKESVRVPQAGLVEEIHVREGDQVAKGQLLARLVNREIALAAAAASSEQKQAQAEFAQAIHLQRATEVQQAVHQLRKAAAGLEEASRQSSELEIRSPYDGVVLTRLLERKKGTFLAQGSELLSIGSNSRSCLLPLNEQEARLIAEGAPVELRFKGMKKRFAGQVAAQPVSLQGRPIPETLAASGEFLDVTHLCEVRISDGAELRPGQTGRARVEGRQRLFAALLWEKLLDAIHLKHRL